MRITTKVLALSGLWHIAFAATAAFWVSSPVKPGETVVVTGSFPESAKLSVKVAYLSGLPGDWQSIVASRGVAVALVQRSEQSVMFILPNLGNAGVYGFRIDQPGQAAVYGRINLPEIWWTLAESPSSSPALATDVLVDAAAPGATLKFFGRGMQSTGATEDVELRSQSGQRVVLKLSADSPYAGSVQLPNDLSPGQYAVRICAGTGEGSSSDARTINVRQRPQVQALTKTSVKDYGAVGDAKSDSTEAFRSAMAKAASLGGGIVAIPAGYYYLSQPLEIPAGVYLAGESMDSSAIYFPDTEQPPEAWIHGTHHFGLSELTIYCGNHRGIIAGDSSNDPAQSGHVRLRHIVIRGSSLRGHVTPEAAAQRLGGLIKSAAQIADTVRVGGEDIIIEDSDLLGTGRSLNVHGARGVIIRNNRLSNGALGWYSFASSEDIVVENNVISGADLLSSGGSYSTGGNRKRSQNFYTANNIYQNMMGWDREAFTSDGGGGAYAGRVAAVDGPTLKLGGSPTWGNSNWEGAAAIVIEGHGMGQWRTITKWQGPNVELSEPFSIAPDPTSIITIVPAQIHYIFFKNKFQDTGVATSFYGTALEHIVAENVSLRAGGFYAFAATYAGGTSPEFNLQYLGNTILASNCYHFAPDGAVLAGPSAIRAISRGPSAMIGLVIRNNALAKGGIVQVSLAGTDGIMKGALVEGNTLADPKQDLRIDRRLQQEVVAR